MEIGTQVDGQHRPAKSWHQRKIGSEINQRGKDAALSLSDGGISNPFLAPGGLNLNCLRAEIEHLQAKPAQEWTARYNRLNVLSTFRRRVHGRCSFAASAMAAARNVSSFRSI